MFFKIKYETHEETLKRLEKQKRIAKMKYEERKLKMEILKLYFPFLNWTFKYNKFIVMFCIVSIVLYTIGAILLQKYTLIELSPTLTTCVFGFFGTELLGLAWIKNCDTKNKTLHCSSDVIINDEESVN